jgi:hypothetical protein
MIYQIEMNPTNSVGITLVVVGIGLLLITIYMLRKMLMEKGKLDEIFMKYTSDDIFALEERFLKERSASLQKTAKKLSAKLAEEPWFENLRTIIDEREKERE